MPLRPDDGVAGKGVVPFVVELEGKGASAGGGDDAGEPSGGVTAGVGGVDFEVGDASGGVK